MEPTPTLAEARKHARRADSRVDSLLEQAYNDPAAARRELDALVERDGIEKAVSTVTVSPEKLGDLHGDSPKKASALVTRNAQCIETAYRAREAVDRAFAENERAPTGRANDGPPPPYDRPPPPEFDGPPPPECHDVGDDFDPGEDPMGGPPPGYDESHHRPPNGGGPGGGDGPSDGAGPPGGGGAPGGNGPNDGGSARDQLNPEEQDAYDEVLRANREATLRDDIRDMGTELGGLRDQLKHIEEADVALLEAKKNTAATFDRHYPESARENAYRLIDEHGLKGAAKIIREKPEVLGKPISTPPPKPPSRGFRNPFKRDPGPAAGEFADALENQAAADKHLRKHSRIEKDGKPITDPTDAKKELRDRASAIESKMKGKKQQLKDMQKGGPAMDRAKLKLDALSPESRGKVLTALGKDNPNLPGLSKTLGQIRGAYQIGKQALNQARTMAEGPS